MGNSLCDNSNTTLVKVKCEKTKGLNLRAKPNSNTTLVKVKLGNSLRA